MRARFGREIVCQVCGKDDAIKVVWSAERSPHLARSYYHYECTRCGVRITEKDESKRQIAFAKPLGG